MDEIEHEVFYVAARRRDRTPPSPVKAVVWTHTVEDASGQAALIEAQDGVPHVVVRALVRPVEIVGRRHDRP